MARKFTYLIYKIVGVDRRRGSGAGGARKFAYWVLGRVPDSV